RGDYGYADHAAGCDVLRELAIAKYCPELSGGRLGSAHRHGRILRTRADLQGGLAVCGILVAPRVGLLRVVRGSEPLRSELRLYRRRHDRPRDHAGRHVERILLVGVDVGGLVGLWRRHEEGTAPLV